MTISPSRMKYLAKKDNNNNDTNKNNNSNSSSRINSQDNRMNT